MMMNNQPPVSLVDQLRECSGESENTRNPYWADNAKMLMRWAADTIDAADFALMENYRTNQRKENGQ